MRFSIFCSGQSLDHMGDDVIKDIKRFTTNIFLNYAPARFDEDCIDMLFWRDKDVTKWLKTQYAGVKPGYKLITMEQGLRGHKDFEEMVDVVHKNKKKDLNYSLTCAMDMLFGLYPDCTVYLFGHDMSMNEDGYKAWYDEFLDSPDNGNRWNATKALPPQLAFFSGYRVYNCNPDTKCTVFPRVDFFEHIGANHVR
jgi:hypothetical protein